MALPVPADYLALALESEKPMDDMTLRVQKLADLNLPTGKLVASDAFVMMDPQPFELTVPAGVFPVMLSIAHYVDDQQVAFASIRFGDSVPVRWEMLTVPGQNPDELQPEEIFGYGVDSAIGCFIDAAAALALEEKLSDESNFFEEMIEMMCRTYVDTWSWLEVPLGEGNLVAFTSGCGSGLYASYAGYDAEGKLAVIVTDFAVVPLDDE